MNKLGIIGAMDIEVQSLKQQLQDLSIHTHAQTEREGGLQLSV